MKSMQYEKTGTVQSKKINSRLTTDINSLSSWRILGHLYNRHSVGVWQVLTVVAFSWAILNKIG